MRIQGFIVGAALASIGMVGSLWLLPEAEAADPLVGTGTGLRGHYYDDAGFVRLHTVRVDPQVSFNWGTGAPAAGMGPDSFTVRWTGELEAQHTETYTFTVTADDAATLYLDDAPVTGPVAMVAGEKRSLRLEYAEGSTYASVSLGWSSPSTPLQVIPTSQLYPAPIPEPVVGAGTGLLAYVYDHTDFTRLFVTRVDTTINHNWGTGSPASGLSPDTFSVRWIGHVEAQRTEDHWFWLMGDDLARLWVDGEYLGEAAGETRFGPVPMVAGELYDIKVEHVESSNYAHARVRWESESMPYGDIPTSQLFPAPEPEKLVGAGDGLRAYVYDASDFTRFFETRVDAGLHHNYGTGSPSSGVHPDTFAVRWIGELEPQLTEGYRFYLSGDDHASLWVNDQLVLAGVSTEQRSAPIPLVAGEKVDIKVEVVEGSTYSHVRVRWESPNTTLQDIPTSQLHSAPLPPPVIGSGSGLLGHYYDASDFTRLFGVRLDPTLSYNWGTGAPLAGMHPDTFSARWYGHLEPTHNESYRLYASGDDWVSVWLDGVKVLDTVSTEARTAPIPLTVGARHSLLVEQAEGSTYAHVTLRWESPNTTLQTIPSTQLLALDAPVPVPGDGDGLLARYYHDAAFTDLAGERIDPAVNFNWGTGAPLAGMHPDTFSARWTGQLLAPYSEDYRFYLSGDDWASLWIDGVKVLDRAATETRTAPIPLEAGTLHDLRVDFAEGSTYAHVVLKWESGNQTLSVIPQAYLLSGGFNLERDAAAIRERAGSLLVDVILSPAQPYATSVDYATSPLTASEGTDYTGVAGTLHFAAGESRKTILVPVADDGVDEANETFRVTLSNPVGMPIGRRAMTNVTILDETPPVTTGLLQGTLGDDGWFVSPVQVTLTSESASEVTIFYRLEAAGDFLAYQDPVLVSAEGHGRIEYYAVDEIGVEEPRKNATFQIDLSTPVTSATLSGTPGNGGWWTSDVTATVSATDAHSGVAATLARLDDAPLAPYTEPFVARGTGTHAVLMQSSDLAGLVEEPVELSFRIDVTPPTTTASVSGVGAGGWFRGPATVTLTATDADSGSPTIAAAIGEGAFAPYTDPLVLSEEGIFTVRFAATDLAGIVEETGSTTVKLDLTAPLVSASVEGALQDGWYRPLAGRSDVRVALSGSDALSGLSGFQWASPTLTNDQVRDVAGATISITTDGEHTILARAVDVAGNLAPWVEIGPIKVDAHAPVLSRAIDADAGLAGWYRDHDATVTVAAADGAGSGIALLEVAVDGGAYAPYDGPIALTGEGLHAITARATDVAGLVATLPFTVSLDATAPTLTFELDGYVRPEDGTFATSVTVTLAADDAVSLVPANGVTHDAPGVPSTQRTFTLTSDGLYSILATAVDTAGNSVSLSESFEILRDNTPPVTTDNAPTGWARGPVTVRLTATDSESPIGSTTYTLDGVTLVQPGNGATTRAFDVPVITNGPHTLTYWSADVAGNEEAAHAVSFQIDAIAPVTTIDVVGAAIGSVDGIAAYADAVEVTLHATDDGTSGLLRTEYRIGTGAWTTYADGEVIRFAQNGVHVLRARSIDVAGNVEGEKTLTVGVDAAAPVLAAPVVNETAAAFMPDGTPIFASEVAITLDASDLPVVEGGDAPLQIEWRLCASCTTQEWMAYTGPISLATEGRFTLHARVTDLAGHLDLASFEFVVDLTTPVFDITIATEGELVDLDGLLYLTGDLCLKVPALDLPLEFDINAEPIASGLERVSWRILDQADAVVESATVPILDLPDLANVTIDLGCRTFESGEYRMQWGGCDRALRCRWGGGGLDSYCEEADLDRCWFRFGWDRDAPATSIAWPPPNSVSVDGYTLPILPSREQCEEAYRTVPNGPLALVCELFVTGDRALATAAPGVRDELRRTTLLAGQVPILVRATDEGVGMAHVDLYVGESHLGRAEAIDARGYYVFLANTTALVAEGKLFEEHAVTAVAADRFSNVGLAARGMTFVAIDPDTEAHPPLEIGLQPPPGVAAVPVVPSLPGRP